MMLSFVVLVCLLLAAASAKRFDLKGVRKMPPSPHLPLDHTIVASKHTPQPIAAKLLRIVDYLEIDWMRWIKWIPIYCIFAYAPVDNIPILDRHYMFAAIFVGLNMMNTKAIASIGDGIHDASAALHDLGDAVFEVSTSLRYVGDSIHNFGSSIDMPTHPSTAVVVNQALDSPLSEESSR